MIVEQNSISFAAGSMILCLACAIAARLSAPKRVYAGVPAAKMLYARKKRDKTKLEVLDPRPRRPFIEYRRGTVELQVQ